MNPNHKSQSNMKPNYSSLFISAVLLSVTGLGVMGLMTTSVGKFFAGLLIGMSIACIVIGFVMSMQSKRE